MQMPLCAKVCRTQFAGTRKGSRQEEMLFLTLVTTGKIFDTIRCSYTIVSVLSSSGKISYQEMWDISDKTVRVMRRLQRATSDEDRHKGKSLGRASITWAQRGRPMARCLAGFQHQTQQCTRCLSILLPCVVTLIFIFSLL